MKARARLLAAVVLGILSVPVPSDAQAQARIVRVGYLTPGSHSAREEVLRRELGRLGYVEGQNLVLEYRSADGHFERLPGLAQELVALKVDVIVAVVTQAALAARKATSTIPIVMVGVSDPVASGLVASLARPGGNVTGTSATVADVVGKQLELLRELLPGVSRVAALWNPANPVFQKQQLGETIAAAAALRVELRFVEARAAGELDRAFASIAGQRPNALLILADPMFTLHRARIGDLAARHRLPTVSGASEYAAAGILATYGPSFADAYRLAAPYVDRILKGAKPADLPVERIAKFELVINARTARALGVTIPQSVAVRAERVIE